VTDFERVVAILLALYLLIGAVFALSMLNGVLRDVTRPTTWPEWRSYWFANTVCFLRWSAGWLPIVLFYCLREDEK